jgi:hypothetical protein
MDRREFFKLVGVTTLAAWLAPQAEVVKPKLPLNPTAGFDVGQSLKHFDSVLVIYAIDRAKGIIYVRDELASGPIAILRQKPTAA